ncbi:N terminal EH domain [Trypanosoma vivax]|uniref:Putative sarcoplasmic reticulum glycoprotein n=1 Tax=Trypanosoma vivax (strain Y486) TaxID=1055687 RepID=G0TUC4_TRYVY|nr:putative sarcoplasmic reticulum glycoprotein [Trypanosoma vivax]KAH8607354.1 N terminal EH domain [Trypanosoma vivax]CCC47558.1 putative sarcoplasmic reticulum glycoprotein [Trypanosoma vivax Y486]
MFKKECQTDQRLGEPPAPEDVWDKHIDAVLTEMKRLYFERIRPIETKFSYDIFHPSWFSESMTQKRPFVLFLGPFSSGKSTFINYLLQGTHLPTGPHPVTDKFTVIMHGNDFYNIPGRVLMADSALPFRGLNQFGESFGEVFEGVVATHPILRSVTLVDTPGVLEASDGHSRRYDYIAACRWFVERSDLVFVLFDPTKLDSGAELNNLFKKALVGHEGKLRIILNKADAVGPQELMRVFGALYWNLSSLVATTEPPRVYISSFWDKPYSPGTDHALFAQEKANLIYDLTETVPLQALDLRVTALLNRASRVAAFMLACAAYKSAMPAFFGKDNAKKKYFENYAQTCSDLANKYRLGESDFPRKEDFEKFVKRVKVGDFYDLNRLVSKKWIDVIKHTIDNDIPMLLKPIKQTSVANPLDRMNTIMMQRQYIERMASQLQNSSGNVGNSYMLPSFPQGAHGPTRVEQIGAQPHVQSVQEAPRSQGFAGGGAAVSQEQMETLMRMMGSMMQQQGTPGPVPQIQQQQGHQPRYVVEDL